jgi:hypothetical protein
MVDGKGQLPKTHPKNWSCIGQESTVSVSTFGEEDSVAGKLFSRSFSLCGLLALTFLLCVLHAHYELMWSDEYGILVTDSVRSVSRLFQVQSTYPVSLDPFVYHLLSHISILCFGPDAFAIRLPSILGFLTMQVCLFTFLKRCSGTAAALFAGALSLSAGTFWYAYQGRPYGVLLGFCGIVAVSWQAAARRRYHRALPLVLLALGLALALNTHYYAVLLFIPLCGAEAVRAFEARRVDLTSVAAIAAGGAGLLCALPFFKAASAYQQHYYTRFVWDIHFVTHAYTWLMVGPLGISPKLQRAFVFALCIALLAFALPLRRKRAEAVAKTTHAEMTMLVLLAALPVCGFLLAVTVTHVVEMRFVASATFGVSALLGLALAALLPSPAKMWTGLALVLAVGLFLNAMTMRQEDLLSKQMLAEMKLPSRTLAAIESRPGEPIYIESPAIFLEAVNYASDPEARSRFGLFYSFQQNLLCCHTDTSARTCQNLRAMTDYPVVSFEELRARRGEQLFVLYHYASDWPAGAIQAAGAEVEYLGPAYGGDLVAVRFPDNPKP